MDEPVPDTSDGDWVEWGGELIEAMGFTEGGAPYGNSDDDFRAMNERWAPRARWAQAKDVLRRVLHDCAGRDSGDLVGRVRFLGSGLTYDVFHAWCRLPEAGTLVDRALVARLPRAIAGHDQPALAQREVAVLSRLAGAGFPLRLPRVLGTALTDRGTAIVQEYLSGVRVDLRTGRMHGVQPWEVVAEAAAACHAVDASAFDDAPLPRATRRCHAETQTARLAELDLPEAVEARAWVREHLPPDEPGHLLHGDLLGQNLLIGIDGEPLGVLDWAFTEIGDPAYDLAIVTRGKKQPFQIDRGLDRLVDAYNARTAGPTLSAADVHLHELHLTAGWWLSAIEQFGAGVGPAGPARNQFLGVLRRALAW